MFRTTAVAAAAVTYSATIRPTPAFLPDGTMFTATAATWSASGEGHAAVLLASSDGRHTCHLPAPVTRREHRWFVEWPAGLQPPAEVSALIVRVVLPQTVGVS